MRKLKYPQIENGSLVLNVLITFIGGSSCICSDILNQNREYTMKIIILSNIHENMELDSEKGRLFMKMKILVFFIQ